MLGAGAFALALGTAAHANNGDPDYLEYDGGTDFLQSDGAFGPIASGPSLGVGFDGISQRNVRTLQGGLSAIPPDTMGAVGTTQFMETSNGAYAIYDKSGALLSMVQDGAFWRAAGQTSNPNFASGDSRVLFDSRSQKWIVESFAPNISTIQIAVSDTSDALGTWKSTSFVGYAGGIADYPTLAMDGSAVYIGTNDFGGPNNSFQGTTLNVISRSDIFGAGGPQVTSLKQFFTPLSSYLTGNDRGYAIQGVNQLNNADKGQIIAIGAVNYGSTAYQVTNPGTAGATETPFTLVDPLSAYDPNAPARQPSGFNGQPSRVIDPLDDRISSAAYELNGKIYTVHTITPVGSDHTAIEWNVVDAATGTLIQKGLISDADHDYFQGSIAINASGQMMLGYNRSGFDENVSFYAQGFNPVSGGNGALTLAGAAILLKVSPIGDYHNGSPETSPPAGRQRWGDYAQVTVDPTDDQSFWLIGEYALGYDSAVSNSRWGTWISNVTMADVPEPATWALSIAGLALLGAAVRRRRAVGAV